MSTTFIKSGDICFVDHPKFAYVKIAALITRNDTDTISVCLLDIAPDTEIPIHIHDPQVDSIYVLKGEGLGYINGEWRTISAGDYIFVPAIEDHGIRNTGKDAMRLYVHHSPPFI